MIAAVTDIDTIEQEKDGGLSVTKRSKNFPQFALAFYVPARLRKEAKDFEDGDSARGVIEEMHDRAEQQLTEQVAAHVDRELGDDLEAATRICDLLLAGQNVTLKTLVDGSGKKQLDVLRVLSKMEKLHMIEGNEGDAEPAADPEGAA